MTTLSFGAEHFRRNNPAKQGLSTHSNGASSQPHPENAPMSRPLEGTMGDQLTLRFSGMTDSKSTPQNLITATPAKSPALQFGFLDTSSKVADVKKAIESLLKDLQEQVKLLDAPNEVAGVKKATELFLKDYQPPSHLIDKTDLTFDLKAPDNVVVSSKLKVRPNPNSKAPAHTLKLNGAPEKAQPGSEDPTMELLEVKVNGQPLPKENYTREGEELALKNLPEGEFTLEIQTHINPQANKALDGLYFTKSGQFMTQCEAEGFRNMTFYPDRPDVMSEFTTTIIADKGKYPQMLSNGNPGARTDRPDGREQITWTDPFKKPAYLFALVAGNLAMKEDTFTTKSGKNVKIQLFVDHGDEDKIDHAMKSVKQAMKWDEERFGLEYDLDLFQVAATNDFNMGAMENKGLNIFNTKYVMANPETATDSDHEHVQGVIGHEYFHNWTGDRVTCRDWFQLSLKEGLTVFRDQEFTSDMNSRAVKRIDDVSVMRAAQFPQDAGAMSHPIRPSAYQSINNFYTATVYNKGAEVIRMIHTLLGEEKFQQGMKLYFQRHDGQAVTTEDFVKAMADASGVDLKQFEKTWYNQAGTPTLDVTDEYIPNKQDPAKSEYRLTIKQSTPPTPGQPTKEPFHIPVRVGLLNPKTGQDMKQELADDQKDLLTNLDASNPTDGVLNLKEGETTFVFKNVPEKPMPSLLRNWSAPVKLNYPYTRDNLTFLMAHDSDGFNRWEAGQKLGVDVLKELVAAHQKGETKAVDSRLIDAFKKVLEDKQLDPALAAQALTLPSSGYLSELYPNGQVDVDTIHAARKQTRQAIGQALEKELEARFDASRTTENRPYEWNAKDAGERALKNTVLGYLTAAAPEKHLSKATAQFDQQHNMTDVQSALGQIVNHGDEATRQAKLDAFYQKHQKDAGVVDKWFSLQAMADRPNTLADVKALMQHEAYAKNSKNPNRMRSLIHAFAANTPHFHNKDGSGYEFIADQIINIDAFNPQVAARLTDCLTTPHKFDAARQALIKKQLERIRDQAQSPDVQEKASKTLDALAEKQAQKAAP
ncbi:MAG TPA: aminopeptidase N [Coleofasciculaceae cyanobacterium]|jgi:aminopeptidase N